MKMTEYNPQKIEKKWQSWWKKKEIYKTKDFVKGKKNFYHLVMFPYPSGDLHIGHWYNFAPADVYARWKKMSGFNVMSPIGFDAFGLPAENAAIKRGIHPEKWTYDNIKTMSKQIESMGNMFDWSREIITSDPNYYKWTQWIFLQLYKKGLAYKKKAPANWCPKCHTVLANEQVVDGKCERCSSDVVQRDIEQWLFRITKYADKLLAGLDGLDWPEKTKLMQKNWIGKSEGNLIQFPISNFQFPNKSQNPNDQNFLEVFTTRIDTILGCTYCVIAPEHKIIRQLAEKIENYDEVFKYIKESKKKTELQKQLEWGSEKNFGKKTGVELKGVKAINPATNKEVPIFVSDYVLAHYGTGAIMAVPAYDERDFEFAQKFNLPIIKAPLAPKDEMTKKLGTKKTINYKLRDWLISRQRYWGAPIPIIFCDKCGEVPVLEKDLPVKLPNVKNYLPTEEGKSPLAHSEKFIKTKCPKCGGPAKRETDTMDTFVCSSWYFLRYADPKNSNKFADAKKIKSWLPINMYVGGSEHAVLHLLYSRFFTKALKDLGHIEFNEPFSALTHQGIILGPDGQKMSKSRGNVIDPDELVKNFGVDAVRMYLCFMGEYSQGGPWNPTGIMGVKRFLERVWKLQYNAKIAKSDANNAKLNTLLHKTIKKVTKDIENFKFNTAISALMILLNEIEKYPPLKIENWKLVIKLLSPFAPHMAEELWSQLKNKNSIFEQPWPKYDPKKIKEETFELVVQINGKTRDKFEAPVGIAENEAKDLTLKRENVKRYIGLPAQAGLKNQIIQKVIFVPNKLINIVIK